MSFFPLEYISIISSILTIPAILIGIYVGLRWLRSQELQRKELQLQREELRYVAESAAKKETDEEKKYGAESGGFIVIDMPDDQKALFHDVLKGFEEYAQVRGYRINFSIDNTSANKIAFKFTIAESGVTVSTNQVKQDLKEYIKKVQKGEPLDDLPAIIDESEHQALVLAMKNRISFLQHTYTTQQNAIAFYEKMLERISNSNLGVVPSQTFYLQTGGDMGNKNYSAVNSPGAVQGEHQQLTGNIIGQNIKVGNTVDERKDQADLLQSLIEEIKRAEELNPQEKDGAAKYIEKVQDEILEEEPPDQNRIAKWLNKTNTYIGHITKVGALYEKAKEAFGAFNIPI